MLPMPTLNAKGVKIHWKLEGGGEPLVLIHGVGSDLTAWDGVVAALQGRHTILRMDLRGHGKSEQSPGPYDLAMFANDVISLLDYLALTQIHLAGFSLGGLVAQQIAINEDERLASLMVISSIAGRTDEEKRQVVARAELLGNAGASLHVADAVGRWFTDAFRHSHPNVVEKRRQKSLQNNPCCYAAAYWALANGDLADELGKITVPTLAMTGECDAGSPPRMSKLIAGRVKNGRAVILPKLKHGVLLEAPGQIASQMENFIQSIGCRRNPFMPHSNFN